MRNIILLLALLLSFSCTDKEKESNSLTVNIDLNKLNDLQDLPSLDNIAEDIEYIKLETDSQCVVGKFNVLKHTTDYLFVKSIDLLMFERRTGKFIRKIGSKGKGPEEYLSYSGIELDEKNKQIYLWDYFKKQFLIYNFQGEFVSSFGIEGLGVDYPTKFKLVDDNKIIVYNSNDMGLEANQLLVINKTGCIFDSIPNRHQFKVIFPLTTFSNQNNHLKLHNNHEVSFKYKRNDTLYHIPVMHKLELKPAYIFNTKKKVKHKCSNREYAFLSELNETERYFFFIHGGHYLMYNKQNEQLTGIGHNKCKGFQNNIDGGLPFWPKYAQGNTLATFYNALELKEKLTKERFEQAEAKSQKKKEDLQELVNSLKIADNPVVMIVNLKQ